MADEVALHGDFAQFRSSSRCEACQVGNHKCVLQESDESCMTCTGAGKKCVFTRTINISGPKATFPWQSLLYREQGLLQLADLNLSQLVQDEALSLSFPSERVLNISSDIQKIERKRTTPESLHYEFLSAPAVRDHHHLELISPAPELERLDVSHPSRKRSRNGSMVHHRSSERPTEVVENASRITYDSVDDEGPHPRIGLDPTRRDAIRDEVLMTLKAQDEESVANAANAEVVKWLETCDESPLDITSPTTLYDPDTESRRTTLEDSGTIDIADGLQSVDGGPQTRSLGKGTRLAEERVDGGSSAFAEDIPYSDSPPAHVDHMDEALVRFSEVESASQEAFPWADPIYLPSRNDVPRQPITSNAAMARFSRRVADGDAVSRAATWETDSQRISDEDMERLFGPSGFLPRLSISKNHLPNDRRTDLIRQIRDVAEEFLVRSEKSSSEQKTIVQTRPPNLLAQSRDDSLHKAQQGNYPYPVRKESMGIQPSGRVIATTAMAGARMNRPHILPKPSPDTLRQNNLLQYNEPGFSSRTNSNSSITENLSRDIYRKSYQTPSRDMSRPNFPAPWSQHESPSFPQLVRRIEVKHPGVYPGPSRASTARFADDEDEADSDDMGNDRNMAGSFIPRAGLPAPTLEGFKSNIREVYPRIAAYLVERIGQEQLRRYSKLVEYKIRHAQSKQLGYCKSGVHCADQGGTPTYLPTKTSQNSSAIPLKALEDSPALFITVSSVVGPSETEEDGDDTTDFSAITAQFPEAFPIPPVKRLPAQFECPFCFQVKVFQKPSDWSKHVHEDLQPFTCTFESCPEPKSFKRKADWIRHENERHRQLEWWLCNEQDCSHICYRRDNFVQHLVREHKFPEPRAKSSKPNRPAIRGPAKMRSQSMRDSDDVSPQDRIVRMVDSCRAETNKTTAEEPCRFCGNVCANWKKLTVHLARHMEQISAPVLELVKQKDVTPTTVVSPKK
ncbi:hypothetical protein MMC26_001965 [Xylographa opegraphella]|nr:hypothetical protein [Xylographa opegraphella]